MNYKKLKVTDKYFPKRFYRVIAIREDISLIKLGHIIGESINCWFEHGFLFKSEVGTFVPTVWLEDDSPFDYYLPLNKYNLSTLGDSFTFEYDTGEGYEFDCKLMKTEYKYGDEYENPLAFVIEGKGQGIFENDHGTLNRYLEGEIDPNSSEEDEKDYMFLPMNMSFETYGDFDKPLELDMMVYYDDDLEHTEKEYINGEREYLGDELYDAILTDEYYDLENEDEDLTNNEIPLRSMIAFQIFENPEVLQIFEKLIKKHNVYESYEMIVDVFKTASKKTNSHYEYEIEVKKELKKLVKKESKQNIKN